MKDPVITVSERTLPVGKPTSEDESKSETAVHILADDSSAEQLTLMNRALSATAEGITISDNLQPDNPLIYANQGFERLTGYKIAEVLGKNCRFLQGPHTDPETVAQLRRAIQEGCECTVEILNYRKDGVPFWNRLSITPVKDGQGRVTNFVGVQSDITERKSAEDALLRTSEQLEAANRRMKRDLDEARQLQLAMLPPTVPKLPHVDIAVCMKTAHEVGGDYYDFHVDQSGTLTIAMGDATGHGLKAGTIVTATKSLFNSWAHHPDPIYVLQKTSSALKKMGFRNMYMAMTIVKITGRNLLISSAGMPFTYFYKASNRQVREIVLKGMPLGFLPDFPYQTAEMKLNSGDTLLFLSDGLPELHSEQKGFFGENRTRASFQQVAHRTPTQIIHHLVQESEQWLDGCFRNDDMTCIVVKAK